MQEWGEVLSRVFVPGLAQLSQLDMRLPILRLGFRTAS